MPERTNVEAAVECVASIAVQWDAGGRVKHFLVDREDAREIVGALHIAGLLKPDDKEPGE